MLAAQLMGRDRERADGLVGWRRSQGRPSWRSRVLLAQRVSCSHIAAAASRRVAAGPRKDLQAKQCTMAGGYRGLGGRGGHSCPWLVSLFHCSVEWPARGAVSVLVDRGRAARDRRPVVEPPHSAASRRRAGGYSDSFITAHRVSAVDSASPGCASWGRAWGSRRARSRRSRRRSSPYGSMRARVVCQAASAHSPRSKPPSTARNLAEVPVRPGRSRRGSSVPVQSAIGSEEGLPPRPRGGEVGDAESVARQPVVPVRRFSAAGDLAEGA